MGTPSNTSQELKVPTIAEKTQVIDAGRKIGSRMRLKGFCEILENMKTILLPFVQWLDKPVNGIWDAPIAFFNMRGMLIFEVPNTHLELPSVALERSGEWFIKTRNSDGGWVFHNASSERLAELFLKEEESLIKLSLEGYRDISRYFIEKAGFMRKIAAYNGILFFVSKCFETVDQAIKEREIRIRIMKERLALLKDLSGSLDPLLASGRIVEVPRYSIFSHDSHGERRSISDYFSLDAVEPFWKYLDSRPSGRNGYKAFVNSAAFRSVPDLIQRMIWEVKEIWSAESNQKTDASSLFGYSSGRLPFTDEEVQVIKKLVDSI